MEVDTFSLIFHSENPVIIQSAANLKGVSLLYEGLRPEDPKSAHLSTLTCLGPSRTPTIGRIPWHARPEIAFFEADTVVVKGKFGNRLAYVLFKLAYVDSWAFCR